MVKTLLATSFMFEIKVAFGSPYMSYTCTLTAWKSFKTEDGMLDNLSPSMATVCKPLQHVS